MTIFVGKTEAGSSGLTYYESFTWDQMLQVCGESIAWINSFGTMNESDVFTPCSPSGETSNYHLNPRGSWSLGSHVTLLANQGVVNDAVSRIFQQNGWQQGGSVNTWASWRLQRYTPSDRASGEAKLWSFWLSYPPINFIEIEMRYPAGFRQTDSAVGWDGGTTRGNMELGTYHVNEAGIPGNQNESTNWHFYFRPWINHSHPAVVNGDWFTMRFSPMPDRQRGAGGYMPYDLTEWDTFGNPWRGLWESMTYFYYDTASAYSPAPNPAVVYPLNHDIGRVRLGWDPRLVDNDVTITCDEYAKGTVIPMSGSDQEDITLRVNNTTGSPISGRLTNWSSFDGSLTGDFFTEAGFPTTPLVGDQRSITLAAGETKTYKLRIQSNGFSSHAYVALFFAKESNFNGTPGGVGHFDPELPWVEARNLRGWIGGHYMAPVTSFHIQVT